MTTRTIRAATDVGGTFTDLVCLVTDPATGVQEIVTAKAHTTPPDYERGVMDVIAKSGLEPGEMSVMAHGTTVVINALTERKGVKTGLITTEGFRDSLEIARGNRPDFFDLNYVKPPPFVSRSLRREVPGRLTHEGEERRPLELDGLPDIVDDFRRADVEAVAICLLHAYANPDHERAVMRRVRELWPDAAAVASHQITREWREYERTSTTVLSAYVQPVAEGYLSRLSSSMRSGGFGGPLYVMQSNCGVDSVEKTSEIPITMVESGPASGFLGAAELGRLIGEPNVLALDIGGTTAKCSLILDGHLRIISDYWIERTRRSSGYPLLVPVVDLVEIGAGGGSIAWVDDFGKLRVGPQSAGAVPGPVAYGLGGTQVTTTDANLALGRINRSYFCGGEIEADMDAVDGALAGIAGALGVEDGTEAARGVIRIANNNMINALKLISLNRGHDPRDFTLVAFGGGGGLHASALAHELGIGKVVVPPAASVFSAWGMLMSDLRRDYFVTRLMSLSAENATRLEALLAEVESAALEQFAREGIDAGGVHFLRHGNLRYVNQEHAVEVPLPHGGIDLDLRDNPDQEAGLNNASRDGSVVAVQMVFMNITGAHASANAGHFRRLALLTRPGPVFDPEPPAAFATYYEVEIRLYDLIWRCLAPHLGNRLPAGSFGSICGTFIGGRHPDTGRHFTIVEPQVGGWGGSANRDGNNAMFSGFHGDTFNCPVEVAETRYGLYVDRLALNDEPGGEGEFRGGKGIVLEYRVRSDGCFFTCAYTRNKHRPWALEGGLEGSPNYVEVARAGGAVETYAVVTTLEVNRDDVIRIHTGSGGGYGDPSAPGPACSRTSKTAS